MHYFPYDVKLGILADSRSFLANQKARNAIVGAENLLILFIDNIIPRARVCIGYEEIAKQIQKSGQKMKQKLTLVIHQGQRGKVHDFFSFLG